MKAKNYKTDGGPRVAIDFDGVIYPGGKFVNVLDLSEPPREGVIEDLLALQEHYEILILTSRKCMENNSKYNNDKKINKKFAKAFLEWIVHHGMPREFAEQIVVYPTSLGKPSVDLFIDDHAYRFEGGRLPSPEMVSDLYHGIYWKNGSGIREGEEAKDAPPKG